MRHRAPGYLALALTLAIACAGDQGPDVSGPPLEEGADTPREAVEELVTTLNSPDFDSAARLVVPGHAALASLGEGATASEVADALKGGDQAVAANFWAGFAQGAGGLLAGELEASEGDPIQQDGNDFYPVLLLLEDGERRQMIAIAADGYRVDLFASFGQGLADKMIPPVERLISSETEDARVVIGALQGIVPSLLVAANQPDITPQAVQDLLRLVELITRVG